MNKECECNCKPKCCTDECCKSPENECKCKNKVVNYWQDEELKPKRKNKANDVAVEFDPDFSLTIH